MTDATEDFPTWEQASEVLNLIHHERYIDLGDYMEEIGMTAATSIVFYARLCTTLFRAHAELNGVKAEPGEDLWAMESDGTPPLAAQLVTTMLNDDPDTFRALTATISTDDDLGQVVMDLVKIAGGALHAVTGHAH